MLIEAMMLGLFVMTSIAVVSSLQSGDAPAPWAAAQHSVHAQLQDALRAFEVVNTNDRFEHVLDKAIARAMQGNTTDLAANLTRVLPPGAGYRMWLDNGADKRLLLQSPNPSGHVVSSASLLWHPDWDVVVLVPGYDVVPPTMAVPIEGYVVAQGSMVEEGGLPVEVTLNTTDALGHAASYHASFTTSLQNGSSAYLTLRDAQGNEGYNWTDPDPTQLPNTTSYVYNDTSNGLPRDASFIIPRGSVASNLTATSSGVGASYTLSLTAPDGSLTNRSVATGAPRVVVLGQVGTWSVHASNGPVPPSGSTVNVSSVAPYWPADWNVTLHEAAGQDIKTGTNLTIVLPAPFTDGAGQNVSQPGWRRIQSQAAPDGGLIMTAEVDGAFNNSARTLAVHADRGVDANSALYLVRAYLGNASASSTSTFVFGNGLGVTTPGSSPVQHTFYASAAKPLTPGQPSQWGFTFTYPSLASNPALAETLQRMDVVAKDGRVLFAAFDSRSVAGRIGWIYDDSSHVHWVPPYDSGVSPNGDYQVILPFTVPPGPSSADEPMTRLPVSFSNAYTDQYYDQAQPNVFTDAFPPAVSSPSHDGFPSDLLRDATVSVNSTLGTRHAQPWGSAAFNTSITPSLASIVDQLRLGLLQCSVTVDKPSVRLGEGAQVTVDFSGLLGRLVNDSSPWSLEASIYDPAQPFEELKDWLPVQSASINYTQAVASGAMFQFNFTPAQDALYGPHVIVAQGHLGVTDQFGVQVNVTARRIGVVNVVPDSGQAATALYWVSLEAWMPDWD